MARELDGLRPSERGIIETVINHFKLHYHIWHTRHRSILSAVTYLMAGIAAYVIEPLKYPPSSC